MTALLLTVVLTGVVFGAYRLSTQAAAAWRSASLLQTQTHLVLERLVADLYAAHQVFPPSPNAPDTLWTIALASGGRRSYRLTRGALYRDGLPLHTSDLSVSALVLTPSAPAVGFFPRRRVRIRLATRAGPRRLALETAVVLRHAPPWPPCCRSVDPSRRSRLGSNAGSVPARWSRSPEASP